MNFRLQDKVRGCFIAGALEAKVENEQELLDTMRSGFCNRAVASTSMNATSSRSHCIVNLFVTRRWTLTEDVQHSKLCLVRGAKNTWAGMQYARTVGIMLP